MKYFLTILVIIIYCSHNFTQIKPDFSPPVKHKIVLSGSFGELRSGHFHSGLDIKSQHGIVGDSIFSIHDGYIGRIKVEPGGYGNSLYVIHPNGYTSVYAHLESFKESIKEFTYQHQLSENCFTIDKKLQKDIFKIKKGEFIGFMGNSGKSFGPHLHFEIRKTKSDKLINPISLGIKPEDNRHPVVRSIHLYEYDTLMNIVNEEKVGISKENANIYRLKKDFLFVNSLKNFSLSVNLFDRMNGASNKNGVYKIQTYINDSLSANICFDSIRFEDSNNIRLLLDQKKLDSDKLINYLFDINIHNLYSFSETNKLTFEDYKSLNFRIEISDYESNKSIIEFIVSEKDKDLKASFSNFVINKNQESLIQLRNFHIQFKPQTFQKRHGFYITQKELTIQKQKVHSIYIKPKYQNLGKPVEIIYKPDSKILDQKYCFAYFTNKGSLKLISNCKSDSICRTKIDKFENVFIMQDTISPTIKPLFKNTDFTSRNEIRFFIQDNLEPSKKTQHLKIEATLNNVWILFKYDLKSNTISYKIDDKLVKGEYDLDLQITDNQNNTSCFFDSIKII